MIIYGNILNINGFIEKRLKNLQCVFSKECLFYKPKAIFLQHKLSHRKDYTKTKISVSKSQKCFQIAKIIHQSEKISLFKIPYQSFLR